VVTEMYNSKKTIDLDPILDVKNLTVTYLTERGPVYTVRNVSLQIAAGEIYGLVGESGSGKTTLARAIVRYLADNGQINSGSVKLGNTDLLTLPMSKMQQVWGLLYIFHRTIHQAFPLPLLEYHGSSHQTYNCS
jgi:ABC-type glutathione transport system ATPase component